MGSINLTAAEIQAIADALAPATTPTPTPAPDGAALYASDCASCHGALASSSKAGRSAAQIQAAINNVGAMGSINLTAAEIQAIADALAPATTPTPTPAPDGAALYTSDCASCHGALASSSKAGRSAAQIQAAITANYGGMGSISLTAAEIQAIADALAPATTPPPTTTPDGAALYASTCAGCHGTLANTTKAGRHRRPDPAAIAGNIGGMNYISLTAAEIQAIADVLPPAPTPPRRPPRTAPPSMPPPAPAVTATWPTPPRPAAPPPRSRPPSTATPAAWASLP